MDVAAQILRRRKQCLVHRYLYYVRAEPQIDDFTYDMWERELRALVTTNPAIAEAVEYADDCPTKTVGSSNLSDYPRELQMVGESLRIYNMENLDWWAKVTGPQEETNEVGQVELSDALVQDNVGGPDLGTGRLF